MKRFATIWQDPVWSKVIATVITGTGTYLGVRVAEKHALAVMISGSVTVCALFYIVFSKTRSDLALENEKRHRYSQTNRRAAGLAIAAIPFIGLFALLVHNKIEIVVTPAQETGVQDSATPRKTESHKPSAKCIRSEDPLFNICYTPEVSSLDLARIDIETFPETPPLDSIFFADRHTPRRFKSIEGLADAAETRSRSGRVSWSLLELFGHIDNENAPIELQLRVRIANDSQPPINIGGLKFRLGKSNSDE